MQPDTITHSPIPPEPGSNHTGEMPVSTHAVRSLLPIFIHPFLAEAAEEVSRSGPIPPGTFPPGYYARTKSKKTKWKRARRVRGHR